MWAVWKQGFYDREKLFWKDLQDVVLFTAAAPPGGGRAVLTPRFVRHFNVLSLPDNTESTLHSIFHSILFGFFKKFDPEVRKVFSLWMLAAMRNYNDAWWGPQLRTWLPCCLFQQLSETVVAATVDVYKRSCTELLPTPAKFHYTFNMRDVAKVILSANLAVRCVEARFANCNTRCSITIIQVFQGLLSVTPRKCNQVDVLARLWAHECMRVFSDRLTNRTDQQWFETLLLTHMDNSFHVKVPEGTSPCCIEDTSPDRKASRNFVSLSAATGAFSAESTRPVVFCNFARPGMEPKLYEECLNFDKLCKSMADYLESYNLSTSNQVQRWRACMIDRNAHLYFSLYTAACVLWQMNLVFFADAVLHVVRVARILSQKRGSALLIGVGGRYAHERAFVATRQFIAPW